MKRLHIHIAVKDLQESINFYATLFGEQPSVAKGDYAKWDLQNPNINLAISTGGETTGVDHIGIQVETPQELEDIHAQLDRASYRGNEEKNASCCYAKSDKYWTMDPQGVAWESFLTKAESEEHCGGGVQVSEDEVSCCVPKALERNKPDGKCCVSSPGSSCCT